MNEVSYDPADLNLLPTEGIQTVCECGPLTCGAVPQTCGVSACFDSIINPKTS